MNKRVWAATFAIPVVTGFCVAGNAFADNSTTVTVNVSNTSLELDVPASPVVLTLRPTATGANFGSVDLTATVGTSNPAGYQLSVTFSDTSLNRTAAIGSSTPEIETLDTLAGGYSQSDFTVNRWGQKVTGDNYFPVPSTSLAPASWSSDGPVNNAANTITLAAKADGTVPAGNYEATLTYTLVANVVEPDPDDPDDPDPDTTTFDEAYAAAGKTKDAISNKYKMQDMSTSICDTVTTPTNTADYSDTPETQLVDIRDGRIYWVAKLMDGKCWMTQNLDLDLESTATNVTALTSENTDLNTYGSNGYDSINGYSQANNVIAWTPERSSTSTISTSGSISNWTNDYNNPYSVDPGDWYWIGNWDNNGSFTWYVSTENNYLNTADSGAGDKFSQDPYTGNGAHGHVGNYYNWPAAVASNNTSSYTMSTYDNITNNPQNSICPAHWRLPTAYSTATDTRNEIQYLLDRYGAYVESGSERDKAITAAPLWFVRGGFVQNINPYGIIQSGHSGYYWSSTVDSVTQYSSGAYALYFNSGNQFYPARALRRDYGFTIRCVVR